MVPSLGRRLGFALLATVALLLGGCVPHVVRQTVHTFTRESSKDLTTLEMDYHLYLPPEYDQPEYRDYQWPLLLFLHGLGENGSNPHKAARIGPPRRIERGHDLPMIVVSPQNDGYFRRLWWNDLLIALLDDVEGKYRVDPDRVYLSGASLGGFGAWCLATAQPDRFAALAPVCGWGYPGEVDRIAHIPVWAFHGATDRRVPLEEGKAMTDALKMAGGSVRLTVFENVGHRAWGRAYRNPELYDWMLEQRRRDP